jgi:hypothetical protein
MDMFSEQVHEFQVHQKTKIKGLEEGTDEIL